MGDDLRLARPAYASVSRSRRTQTARQLRRARPRIVSAALSVGAHRHVSRRLRERRCAPRRLGSRATRAQASVAEPPPVGGPAQSGEPHSRARDQRQGRDVRGAGRPRPRRQRVAANVASGHRAEPRSLRSVRRGHRPRPEVRARRETAEGRDAVRRPAVGGGLSRIVARTQRPRSVNIHGWKAWTAQLTGVIYSDLFIDPRVRSTMVTRKSKPSETKRKSTRTARSTQRASQPAAEGDTRGQHTPQPAIGGDTAPRL